MKEVINGRSMMFWQDKWYSDVPLGMLFPKLFSSRVQVPTGPVLSHWFDTGWNIKVPYLNQGEDMAKRENLQLECLDGGEG